MHWWIGDADPHYSNNWRTMEIIFLLKWSDIQGSLDYSIRAQSQKDIQWISPADNHDFCQDEWCQEIFSKHMLCE
jgi:hypothetical protein